jgi:hypothetical protein
MMTDRRGWFDEATGGTEADSMHDSYGNYRRANLASRIGEVKHELSEMRELWQPIRKPLKRFLNNVGAFPPG